MPVFLFWHRHMALNCTIMTIQPFTCLLVLTFLVATHESPAQTKQSIDSLVQHYQRQYDIPGLAVGVVKDGQPFFSQGYGVADISSGLPVSDSSVFHAASISKLFTAQAVLLLVQQGKLQLDTKLADMIPGIARRDSRVEQITVRQMLNHTSGLPDVKNYRWRSANESPGALEKYITGLKPRCLFEPGSQYQYSNLAYDILGYIVQKAAGMPFEEYVALNILVPSGMTNSDFRYFTVPPHLRTSPHTRKGRKGAIKIRSYYPYNREHSPSSTLNTSAKDLCMWMSVFLRQTAPSASDRSYLGEMMKAGPPFRSGAGLGFQLGELKGFTTAGHYGGDKGFRSYLVIIPAQQLGLVVLANCDFNEEFRQDIVHSIADLLLPEE